MANKSMLFSLKIGAMVAKIIPRKIGLRIAWFLGSIYGLLPMSTPKRIRKIHRVISPGLNESLLRKRSAAVLGSYAQYWWDVFWLSSKRTAKEIYSIVNIEGRHHLDAALKFSNLTNQGVIVALPHMGSWEIAGAWFAHQGHPLVAVAERLKPPELFDLFTKTRLQSGIEIIAHDDHPTAKLMAALKDKKMICLVADRDISKRGIEIDFFGKKKSMPTGPGAIALKTGSIILPTCIYQTIGGEVDVRFYEPISPADYEQVEKETAVTEITRNLTSMFEDMISRDPAQWHVLSYEWSDDGL